MPEQLSTFLHAFLLRPAHLRSAHLIGQDRIAGKHVTWRGANQANNLPKPLTNPVACSCFCRHSVQSEYGYAFSLLCFVVIYFSPSPAYLSFPSLAWTRDSIDPLSTHCRGAARGDDVWHVWPALPCEICFEHTEAGAGKETMAVDRDPPGNGLYINLNNLNPLRRVQTGCPAPIRPIRNNIDSTDVVPGVCFPNSVPLRVGCPRRYTNTGRKWHPAVDVESTPVYPRFTQPDFVSLSSFSIFGLPVY